MSAALLLSAGLLAGPQQAAACACGAVVSDAAVNGETSIVAWDGQRQSIDMLMMLDGSAKNAGWIMPTPAPAEITLGSHDAFSALASAVAPKVVTKRVFHFGFGGSDGSGGEPRSTGSGAIVLSTTEIGPFTVTALTGSDASQVNTWLTRNGYQTRDDLVAAFQRYLDQGWVLQAVKLTTQQDATFRGSLPPLRLTFDTAEPVYPLRLSGHATVHQDVRIYVLAETPMAISSQPGDQAELDLIYAGRQNIADLDFDSPLVTNESVYLTAYEASFDPDDITDDVVFEEDSEMPDYQRVRIVHDNIAEGPISLLLVGLLVAAPLVVIALVVRRVTRP